jgi:hypothetical protein
MKFSDTVFKVLVPAPQDGKSKVPPFQAQRVPEGA